MVVGDQIGTASAEPVRSDLAGGAECGDDPDRGPVMGQPVHLTAEFGSSGVVEPPTRQGQPLGVQGGVGQGRARDQEQPIPDVVAPSSSSA